MGDKVESTLAWLFPSLTQTFGEPSQLPEMVPLLEQWGWSCSTEGGCDGLNCVPLT